MATVKIEVTSEGWTVEVHTEETSNAITSETCDTIERIAQAFIQARHQIERETAGPEFQNNVFDRLETLLRAFNDRQEEATTEEAESIHDSSGPNGSTYEAESIAESLNT